MKEDILEHISNPPYGTSNTTLQGGVQLNHRLNDFLNGSNVLTVGTEYLVDDVLDIIDSYNYKIDQTTKNLGTFFQSDWEITSKLNLLSGVRVDNNNLVDNLILSPRFPYSINLTPIYNSAQVGVPVLERLKLLIRIYISHLLVVVYLVLPLQMI